ncbi:c-type cytochrome [Enterovibrio calviensis]|uniref:c-type cytochrome n=1 Tax=Enterovibrio calviensis TaxID=91359 RepID=UPI0037365387
MKRYLTYLSATFALVTHSAFAVMPEGNPELGEQKAYSCQFCHGATGYSLRQDYPNLNGQHAEYLFNAIKHYQKGERGSALGMMMKQQVSSLNDQDLADVAAFYSEQKPGKPE